MQGDDFGVVQPLAHVTARFPSLSITRIATRKPCQPQAGRKTPPWHSPRGATGTRPRCCPLSASRRPGWQGGTRRGAHGGSPGAGCCESRAPGCRRWPVPPSSVPSPSPAAAASPARCPQPPREASAHHPGTDPETRQRVHAGRAGQLLPGPPPNCFWKGQNELSPMQGAHRAFGEHLTAHDSLPRGQRGHCRGRRKLAGRGLRGCPTTRRGQLPIAFHSSATQDASNTFFGERRRDLMASMGLGCIRCREAPRLAALLILPGQECPSRWLHQPLAASPFASTLIFKCPY